MATDGRPSSVPAAVLARAKREPMAWMDPDEDDQLTNWIPRFVLPNGSAFLKVGPPKCFLLLFFQVFLTGFCRGSFPILFNHRSFRKPDPFSWVSGGFRKKNPCKEWGR